MSQLCNGLAGMIGVEYLMDDRLDSMVNWLGIN